MPRLEPHGVQLWTDFEGAGGSHLVTVVDAQQVTEQLEVNGPETLELQLPRSSDAWDTLAQRQVVRLEFDDGTVLEYRIVAIDEEHSSSLYGARLKCEGPLFELLGPGLCERVETNGVANTQFELLAMTPTEHVDAVIIPAGPTWITKGTIEPTDPIDVLYEDFTPLRALQVLLERTGGERELERQANGTYKLNVRDQLGSGATTPQFRLGKNLRRSGRRTDDRETITRIYPVGGDDEFGRVTVAEARWEVIAKPTGTTVVLEATHRGSQYNPVWKDDALNGIYVGNPDRTEVQQISDSVLSTGRITVANSGLYAVAEELMLFRNAAGDALNYVDDLAQIAGDADRRVEVLKATDVPPARNLAQNPRLDQYTAGNPDDVSQVGTPTTFAEETSDEHHQIGSSSLRVVCDARLEGAEMDAVTLVPTDDRPYFAALCMFKLVSGKLLFQLVHSVLGIVPAEDATVRAISSRLDSWEMLEIVPGDDTLLTAGTLKLQVLAEDTAAEFYLDAWQLSQTAVNFPLYDGQPAVELWNRAVARFTDDGISTPKVSYELDAVDLVDSVFEFDALTLGGDVLVVDDLLDLETTVRALKLGRDWQRPELVKIELASIRALFTDDVIPQRRRRPPPRRGEETLVLELTYAEVDGISGELRIVWAGAVNVNGLLWLTSTAAQPTRAAVVTGGNSASGRSGSLGLSLFLALDQVGYVTLVPVNVGVTKLGPTYELNIRASRESGYVAVTTLMSPYVILPKDGYLRTQTIIAGITLTWPLAGTFPGRRIHVNNIGGNFAVTNTPAGGDTIAGVSPYVQGFTEEHFVSDGGTNWALYT